MENSSFNYSHFKDFENVPSVIDLILKHVFPFQKNLACVNKFFYSAVEYHTFPAFSKKAVIRFCLQELEQNGTQGTPINEHKLFRYIPRTNENWLLIALKGTYTVYLREYLWCMSEHQNCGVMVNAITDCDIGFLSGLIKENPKKYATFYEFILKHAQSLASHWLCKGHVVRDYFHETNFPELEKTDIQKVIKHDQVILMTRLLFLFEYSVYDVLKMCFTYSATKCFNYFITKEFVSNFWFKRTIIEKNAVDCFSLFFAIRDKNVAFIRSVLPLGIEVSYREKLHAFMHCNKEICDLLDVLPDMADMINRLLAKAQNLKSPFSSEFEFSDIFNNIFRNDEVWKLKALRVPFRHYDELISICLPLCALKCFNEIFLPYYTVLDYNEQRKLLTKVLVYGSNKMVKYVKTIIDIEAMNVLNTNMIVRFISYGYRKKLQLLFWGKWHLYYENQGLLNNVLQMLANRCLPDFNTINIVHLLFLTGQIEFSYPLDPSTIHHLINGAFDYVKVWLQKQLTVTELLWLIHFQILQYHSGRLKFILELIDLLPEVINSCDIGINPNICEVPVINRYVSELVNYNTKKGNATLLQRILLIVNYEFTKDDLTFALRKSKMDIVQCMTSRIAKLPDYKLRAFYKSIVGETIEYFWILDFFFISNRFIDNIEWLLRLLKQELVPLIDYKSTSALVKLTIKKLENELQESQNKKRLADFTEHCTLDNKKQRTQ